jgi:hypothetical protein
MCDVYVSYAAAMRRIPLRIAGYGNRDILTLCFSLSSLLNGALMIVRRTLEGAPKCALRDFLRDE